MAKKKYDEQDGVWRTIGGRRVFIRTGQSLGDAMKESGKFKKTSDVKREEYQYKNDKLERERQAEISRKYIGKEKRTEEGQEAFNKYAELHDRTYIRENPKEADTTYDLVGQHINKEQQMADIKRNNDLREAYKNDLISKEDYKNDNYDALKEKYSHAFPYHKQTEAEKKYADDVAEYFKGKDIKEEVRKAKEEFNKTQKTGNDYLPKASKITTQGTSNRKEVSDNIQAHILEHYENPVDFMEQMNAMDYLPTKWRAGEELASGGSYLIYYDDQREFLDSLGINPKGKEFSDDRVFQTYNSLIGRESERLYNKLEKLYDKYKAEHPNSNVSLDDFRKWFK